MSAKMKLDYILNNAFLCEYCERDFVRKYDLERHLKTNHGLSKKCKLCGKLFKSASRRDARVRHLSQSCPKFKLYFSSANEQTSNKIARDNADEFFE